VTVVASVFFGGITIKMLLVLGFFSLMISRSPKSLTVTIGYPSKASILIMVSSFKTDVIEYLLTSASFVKSEIISFYFNSTIEYWD